MAADVLASSITRSSAAMILTHYLAAFPSLQSPWVAHSGGLSTAFSWWRSPSGNVCSITGPLWREFTGLTKASDVELWHFYPRPVLASGYCRCLCLCVCINHLLVRTITRHLFKLGSPNLVQRSKTPWLRFLLFCGVIDLDLQGQI